jgi:hypothetical protein
MVAMTTTTSLLAPITVISLLVEAPSLCSCSRVPDKPLPPVNKSKREALRGFGASNRSKRGSWLISPCLFEAPTSLSLLFEAPTSLSLLIKRLAGASNRSEKGGGGRRNHSIMTMMIIIMVVTVN